LEHEGEKVVDTAKWPAILAEWMDKKFKGSQKDREMAKRYCDSQSWKRSLNISTYYALGMLHFSCA
jgi:hypothetical protein